MRAMKRIAGIAAGAVCLAGQAHATTTIVAGPTAAFLPDVNDVYCHVLNTGPAPAEFIIEARDATGIAKAWKKVTLAAEQGTSLFGGDEVASCYFSGSKRMVGMLIGRDLETGNYSVVIPAHR